MIRLRGICRDYPVGEEVVHALDHVDLDIGAGEYISIMGPSGSGKSTLLNVIGLLDRPNAGTYELAGRDVSGLDDSELAALRQEQIGFIFQSFHLVPSLNALENVMLPLELGGNATPRKSALDILQKVGLGERVRHYPSQLSGGEMQRVAIARAFATGPAVLFADEPTGNLDSRTGDHIMNLMFELNRSSSTTLLLVTHDKALARRCDREISLDAGRLVGDRKAA